MFVKFIRTPTMSVTYQMTTEYNLTDRRACTLPVSIVAKVLLF